MKATEPGLEHQAPEEWPFPQPFWFTSCPFHCFFNQLAASICKLYGCELHYKEKCWAKGCCHLRE